MEITRLTYKELFTVKLRHNGYDAVTGSTLFNRLSIMPDTDTKVLFSRYGIDYRLFNDAISCFIRTEYMAAPAREPQKPFTPISEDFKLRFLVTAQTEFINNTFI